MIEASRSSPGEKFVEPALTKEVQRFQILSLDGGGIKGLFSAALLAALEDDLRVRVTDHFDLIAGTSTGGILALGLGAGMSPRELVEFYLHHGPAVFDQRFGLKSLQHWISSKFSAAPLQSALQDCFQDKRLADSRKRLVITSFNLGDDDIYLFRTPHLPKLRRDYKVPMWKIALATAAAPTFFPVCRSVERVRLIDGGVWANNPAMVGIVEAFGPLEVPLSSMRVFSLGTSQAIPHRRRRLDSGGIVAWAMGNVAVDVIMRGQTIAASNQARFLVGPDRFVRVDPAVASSQFSLDGAKSADDLIGKASHYSRTFSPQYVDVFGSHEAAPFSPLHS